MRGLEIWDILDKEGNKTGKTMQKGEELPEGFYHQGADIWILNSDFDAKTCTFKKVSKCMGYDRRFCHQRRNKFANDRKRNQRGTRNFINNE